MTSPERGRREVTKTVTSIVSDCKFYSPTWNSWRYESVSVCCLHMTPDPPTIFTLLLDNDVKNKWEHCDLNIWRHKCRLTGKWEWWHCMQKHVCLFDARLDNAFHAGMKFHIGCMSGGHKHGQYHAAMIFMPAWVSCRV